MTACIVGWSHGKFGKLDGETSESLIVKAASEAIAHAGIEPKDIDVIYVGNMNGGFVRQEFHSSLAAAGPSRPALQALDPRRERLRHRLGRDPYGPEHAGRRQGALRAGGRRREDDRAQQRAGGRGADQGVVRRRGGRHRSGLRRHLRQDHLGLLPALRRQVRRARQDRGQGAQERRQEPVSRISRRNSPTTSAALPRTRTRSSRGRSSAPTARRSPTAPPPWCWPTSAPRSA